jgi:DNA-binding NarL/FixJ family response regulator
MTTNTLKTLPNIVYYNDDHSKSPKCTGSVSKVIKCTYTLPSTWTELTQEIEHGAEFLAFHLNMIDKSELPTAEFISAIQTIRRFCKYKESNPLKIMVLITPHTPFHRIKELQRLSISGIGLDLTCYPLEEVARCTEALLAGKAYWPKHILSQLPGQPPKKVSAKNNVIHISPRQQQVLNLIKTRGLANKQIAKALAISENTVKMHVGDIMRAYGVRTRVQLAVLAQEIPHPYQSVSHTVA